MDEWEVVSHEAVNGKFSVLLAPGATVQFTAKYKNLNTVFHWDLYKFTRE